MPAFPELAGLSDLTIEELEDELERLACERSLYQFLRSAWPYFDSSEFVGGWHLEAICEHLEAVTRGEIRKLLINVPPRHGKTGCVAIAWPCWTWALEPDGSKLRGAGVRFLCGSYGAKKAQQDAVTARRLLGSQWYRRLWGDRVLIAKDRDNQEQYDTLAGGSRISTGIAESLGKGGIIRILDDPHKTDEVESADVLASVVQAYDEVWSTRSNDPDVGAEVIIMQRLAYNDLSAHVAERGFTWLSLPAEHDTERHCITDIGWVNPRTEPGEPLWPERFSTEWLRAQEELVGPYAYAGQYQQTPIARGGSIIEREWWKIWPPLGKEDQWVTRGILSDGTTSWSTKFPSFGTIIAAFDGALSEKDVDRNSYHALTVWAAFPEPETNRPKIMLKDAWRMRGPLHDVVKRMGDTCREHKVDTLLIENKASGSPAAQEIRRLYGDRAWRTILLDIKGDKTARLRAVEPLFAGGLIFAPETTWSELVIEEICQFPRAANNDWVDTASMGLGWLRRNGVMLTREEHDADEIEIRRYRKPEPALYDV